MEKLLTRLKELAPSVTFAPGDSFFWSPQNATVTYSAESPTEDRHLWTLLHETAHALLDHRGYNHDLELLLLEVAAWQKAKQLATNFGINIDEDYIQDCLDTYRDWLHHRSTCPACKIVSLQISSTEYQCHNCSAKWEVSSSRFCRPYRRLSNKKPLAIS